MRSDMKSTEHKKPLKIIENDVKTKDDSLIADHAELLEAEKAKNGTLNQMIRLRNTHISEMSRSLEVLNSELKSLKESNADFKATNRDLKDKNRDLKDNNRDLNAKLSRLQNTIDNLQRALREQATKILDDIYLGIKK